jgi:imidazoleglycerol-phosphate dehydratase
MTDMLHRIRRVQIERKTGETDIRLALDLDGKGQSRVSTGVPFLDHMIDAFSRHSTFDIDVSATGDTAMDPHHTVEDVGIVLGQGIRQALGDRAGIARYGFAYAPLDEALCRFVVDCSGRPYLDYNAAMPEAEVATNFASSLVEEFWRALVINGYLTVHIDLIRARNAHHAAESMFKAAAVALCMATRITGEMSRVPSTKGVLA